MLNLPVEALVQYVNKTITSGIIREDNYTDSRLLMYPEDNSKPFVIGELIDGHPYFENTIRRVVMDDTVYENPEYVLARSLADDNDVLRRALRKVFTHSFTPQQLFEMLDNAGRR